MCESYGWTVDHVLSMPAVRFFSMRKAGLISRARNMAERCDIAAIPLCDSKYYEAIRARYEQEIDFLSGNYPQEIEIEQPAIDSASVDAKYAMQALFTAAKGGR